ncbi:MAG: protoglobin domain-containing protein [Candidatus Xenobia bacterium]
MKSEVRLDGADIDERLGYLLMTLEDEDLLKELHPVFVKGKDEFLDHFYQHLMRFDGTRAVLKDEATRQRAKKAQGLYMERMLTGPFDAEFYIMSVGIGLKHHEVGLEPKWMVGAWNLYLLWWTPRIFNLYKQDTERALKAVDALHKVILLNLSLGMDAYYGKALERIQHVVTTQRQAIMELSTPVIQVWEGILVLPLIGTIDSVRTRQIMESLLTAVVQYQAEVVLMDLTGVSVVDTAVAHHLMKTVEAAELLGTKCMLTGISPAIAQTIVHLGVDLGHISTAASLKIGLQQALKARGVNA